jgi:hypothetical protein
MGKVFSLNSTNLLTDAGFDVTVDRSLQRLKSYTIHSSYSRGVTAIASATWSDLDVTAPIQNGVRLSAETLSDMIDYLIDHSYVEHTGIIYRQVIGMAMGVHNAPQMGNLYCASYELQYVLRRSMHYLAALKLYATVPSTPRDKMLRAEMASLFNMCRLMDDIAVVGMPASKDVAAMLLDERVTRGTDGIYPAHMTDSRGNVITNPMQVNKEKHGLTCSYLDMLNHFRARGDIQFELYNKLDEMPVFKDYRRFPHVDSMLAHSTKYNVFKSQLHRFASRCNHWSKFTVNAKRLLTEMTALGYSKKTLLKDLDGFWLTYAEQQKTAFQITVRNPKQLWLRVMKECRTSPSQSQQSI